MTKNTVLSRKSICIVTNPFKILMYSYIHCGFSCVCAAHLIFSQKSKKLLLLGLMTSSVALHAATTPQNWGSDVSEAQSDYGQLMTKVGQENINTVPGYTPNPNPSETQYYGNSSAMNAAAENAFFTNSGAQAIQTSFDRPQYQLNLNSPEMQKSALLMQNAKDISEGKSNQYVNCQTSQSQQCKITYKQQTCTTTNSRTMLCNVRPSVQITTVPQVVPNCQNMLITQGAGSNCPSGYNQEIYSDMLNGPTWDDVRICTQVNNSISANPECYPDAYYILSAARGGGVGNGTGTVLKGLHGEIKISNVYDQYVVGNITDVTTGQVIAKNTQMTAGEVIQLPYSETQDQVFDFSLNWNQPCWRPKHWPFPICAPYNDNHNTGVMTLIETHKGIYQQTSITNVNSCAKLPPVCQLTNSTCVDSGGTRNFYDIPVYESCWDTRNTYQCGPKTPQSTCAPLMAEGCSAEGSTCTDEVDNFCEKSTDTFNCPDKTCTSDGIICGGDYFCEHGNCYEPKTSTNANFGKDDAEFAAAAGVGQSIGKQSNQKDELAFGGQAMSCSKTPILSYLNCCNGTGWGKNIHLAQCSAQAKQLGQARQHGLTTYVGTYCSHYIPIVHICTEHREVYCVFNSVLAQDIQSQGRQGQLGIGFGGAQSPDCSGLSPTTLQKMDFGKMNFDNLLSSESAKFPNANNVEQNIAERIKQLWNNRGGQ